MSPETPEELEVRLTALLLGELPAEEAFALGRAIEQDPELAKLYARLQQTVSLVREAAASSPVETGAQPPPLKLREPRRQKLLEQFKTVEPEEFVVPQRHWSRWLAPVAAAAAVVLFLATLAVPNFIKARTTAQSNSIINNLRQIEGAKQQWALENKKTDEDRPTMADLSPYLRGGAKPIAGEAYIIGKVGEPVSADLIHLKSRGWLARLMPTRSEEESSQRIQLSADGGVAVADKRGQSLMELARADAPIGRSQGNKGWEFPSGRFPNVGSLGELKQNINQTPVLTDSTAAQPGVTTTIALPAATVAESPANSWSAVTAGTTVVTNAAPTEQLSAFDSASKYRAVVDSDAAQQSVQLAPRLPDEAFRRRYGLAPQQGTANVERGSYAEVPPAQAQSKDPSFVVLGTNFSAVASSGSDAWMDDMHSKQGNVGFADGSVQAFSTFGLQEALRNSGDTGQSLPFRLSEKSGGGGGGGGFGGGVPKASPPPISPPEQVAVQMAKPPAQIDPTTGLPVASAAPVIDPTTGLPAVGGEISAIDPTTGLPVQPPTRGKPDRPVTGDTPLLGSLFATNRSYQGGTSVYSLNVVGHTSQITPNGFKTASTASRAEKEKAYADAKRELQELQRFRQVLDFKMASEKTDVELPKTAMVEVIDTASESEPKAGVLERIRRGLGGSVERTARVKLERDQSDISGLNDRQLAQAYDPSFIQIETEAIRSDAVLGKVIDQLALSQTWSKERGGKELSKDETLALLRRKIEIRPVPKTSILEIRSKSDNPEEAAKIANAVAKAYKDRWIEQRLALSRGGVDALTERIKEEEVKVGEQETKVNDLRQQLQVPDSVASSASQGRNAAKGESDEGKRPVRSPEAPIPQPEVPTRDNAFSTFSLNVSDVSFKLAAASLEKGQMPEPASVRSEEFINAFDYRDPEPAAGAPVAFAWERARYPFALNRDLLRFSLKTAAEGRQTGRPLNIVLLLDNSGSMERADRVAIIREALRVLAGQLHQQDRLSVVTFSRTARLWVDGVPGDQAGKVAEDVSGLTPQGGTNLEEAMNLAYQTAARHYLPDGINRVVLLTDGAANLGDVEPESLKQKVEAQRKQGIALDCFGIGWDGYNDDLLEVLSRNGDGRYGFVNTPEEAAAEFAGQLAGALRVAAADVKVQVEFNPNRVTAYRQIGYAKHQLTKEQFRDNTVDAAELGAAKSGNALYVIEVNSAGDGPLGTVRVRYQVPGTSDYREQEWQVPYTGSAVALEQATAAMRLATAASGFSEWLAGSPYASEVTLDRLLGYLGGVPDVYGADGRPKKLEWMIRQAKSVAGK